MLLVANLVLIWHLSNAYRLESGVQDNYAFRVNSQADPCGSMCFWLWGASDNVPAFFAV